MLSILRIVDLRAQALTTCLVCRTTTSRVVRMIRVVDDLWLRVSHVRILDDCGMVFGAVECTMLMTQPGNSYESSSDDMLLSIDVGDHRCAS